jgi:hypothetical protein
MSRICERVICYTFGRFSRNLKGVYAMRKSIDGKFKLRRDFVQAMLYRVRVIRVRRGRSLELIKNGALWTVEQVRSQRRDTRPSFGRIWV